MMGLSKTPTTPKSLNQFILKSWLITGLIAIITSLVLFFSVGYYDYSKSVKNSKSDLINHSNLIARRISAELLINKKDVADLISLRMAKELNLKSVDIIENNKIQNVNNLNYEVTTPVPYLENQYSILVKSNELNLVDYLNLKILMTSLLIISFITIAGSFLQMKYIYRNIIRPIKDLVGTSTGQKQIKSHWPMEVQDISNQLSQSFQDRDQVVFSQIARGVIHDIKTLLQSMQVASDLASEKETENRFKNLLTVNQINLPKLLEIINTTLDGSRDILISPTKNNLNTTIENSIQNLNFLITAHLVTIKYLNNIDENLCTSYDAIQLERVFTNIIKNGIESILESKVENKIIQITVLSGDKNIIISIEDSGCGFLNYNSNSIRFLKSTKSHGSGLGLTISRKIVESHKGTLVIEKSKSLGGAKVIIQLPITDATKENNNIENTTHDKDLV